MTTPFDDNEIAEARWWAYWTAEDRARAFATIDAIRARAEGAEKELAESRRLLALAEQQWRQSEAALVKTAKERDEARVSLACEATQRAQALTDWRVEKDARALAEKERDEARGEWTDTTILLGNERSARLRAEADNAALLDSLKAMTQGAYTLGDLGLARARASADHPGAALLEYVRSLEEVREAAISARAAMRLVPNEDVPPGYVDAEGNLALALARADELKKVKP
jgi:hypothetical protein